MLPCGHLLQYKIKLYKQLIGVSFLLCKVSWIHFITIQLNYEKHLLLGVKSYQLSVWSRLGPISH